MRWAGYEACMRERRGAYGVFVLKPEGRRPLGRPIHNLIIIMYNNIIQE